jgi:biopolymer transport protein ExbD
VLGVYSDMLKALNPLLGTAIGLIAFFILPRAWLALSPPASGIPVLLSHQCTQQELMNMGDGREIFIRYNRDHSSLVNDDLMRTEHDLRREIRAAMATRAEQVVFFVGDDTLPFGQVSEVLADLKADDPALWIVFLTKEQRNAVRHTFPYLPVCLPRPNSM